MKKQKYVYIVLESTTSLPGYEWNLSRIRNVHTSKKRAEDNLLKHIELLINELGYVLISDNEYFENRERHILLQHGKYKQLYSITKCKLNTEFTPY